MSVHNQVPSVNSAIRIIETLTKEEFREVTLTTISTHLDINKSTCLRILKTLTHSSIIKYDENTKTYSLGPTLISLGERAKELNDYIRVASSFLPELAKNGITFVLVKKGRDADLIYVAKEEPPLKIRLTISTGDSFPIPAGAIGKCFYSYLPQKEAESIVKKELTGDNLMSYTKKSVISIEVLNKQREIILKKGIAESHGEYSPGISAYACPIFDNNKNIILCLGVYLPTLSTNDDDIDISNLKDILKKASSDITNAISSLV